MKNSISSTNNYSIIRPTNAIKQEGHVGSNY